MDGARAKAKEDGNHLGLTPFTCALCAIAVLFAVVAYGVHDKSFTTRGQRLARGVPGAVKWPCRPTLALPPSANEDV